MKILLTVHQFLPKYSAGTEILTLDTAKELRRLGHDVSIFTGHPAASGLRSKSCFDEYVYDGIPVYRYHHSDIASGDENALEKEYNNHIVVPFFRSCVEKLDPDIVHFFHLGRLSASVIDVCVARRIPMVLTPTDFWFVCPTNQLRLPDSSLCTGPDPDAINCLRHIVAISQPVRVQRRVSQMPNWFLKSLTRAIHKGFFSKFWFSRHVKALISRPSYLQGQINKIGRVLVPTRLMETILAANGLARSKIKYCPYGINLSHITHSLNRGVKPILTIGFIGTLFEHKGVHVLVRAISLLPRNLPLELLIYGKQDEFPEYVDQLRHAAASDARIMFCGSFPNDTIGKVLSALDALVVPSIWYENTPLVVYSAQAAGCPVIGSNLAGIAEVISHEVNGLLFKAGDASALAQCIGRLVNDRAFVSELAKGAKRPKSTSEYAQEVECVYRETQDQSRLSV